MKKSNREEKVQEIMKLAIELKFNVSTLVFVLVFTNDKALTKFHKEFMEKNSKKLVISE